jgi:methylenetetrahydrofolate reductase (NADPH)
MAGLPNSGARAREKIGAGAMNTLDTLHKESASPLRSAILRPQKRKIEASFEFSPPRSTEMEEILWKSIKRLEPLAPKFVSVTYGAGGSTRERTHETVKRIVEETSLTPAAHLTCVAAGREEVDEVIQSYWDCGVRHIVALRGDPPAGIGEKYVPHPGGYADSPSLIEGIKRIGDFEISVGCYPEVHPDAASADQDIETLKRKVDAGATRAMTQFFFDPELFLRYLERVRAAGINIPIVPGIMPANNFKGMCRMASKAGASVPGWLHELFEPLEGDAATRKLVAAAVVVEQCLWLLEHDVTQFHFYTMNRADLTYAICHILGIRPNR